ncbi:hypothetical protein PENTCL1PPCAC_8735, partial [Pristionchus entomophagus]
QVILSRPGTPHCIVDGFNRLETLLESETTEPKIWEEVYPFLMRFQLTIERMDCDVARMVKRYMYLQAKKIIDKHGWLSKKPLTKFDGNRKGLMRSVAIQLLAFSFGDPIDSTAEEFAQSGFRKLGFKAVEQYPHCGLLW